MMTAVILLVVLVIFAVWLIRKKPQPEPQSDVQAVIKPVPSVPSVQAADDAELVAVITAAIAEYTSLSADGFTVLDIRCRSEKWIAAGRQEAANPLF